MPDYFNVATALAEMAARAPYRPGVVFPAGRDTHGRAKTVQLSFQQLNEECDRYAHGLSAQGIRQGDHVLLLLRPGVELIAVVFALAKMGAVPILIDPGMGRKAFLQCVAESEPVALIGLPIAHLLRRLLPGPFKSVQHAIVVAAPRFLAHGLADTTLRQLHDQAPRRPFPVAPTTTENEAAVAFTSGSTGIPKGVVYRHGIFKAQIALLRNTLGIAPGEVDLALLYIFALFNPALGVTTIIPDMDPTKSAEVNPAYVVESIHTHGVTNAFGSPTIWKRVVPYCREHGLRLPSLKRVIMAGAPVPPELIAAMADVLAPEAQVLTPFGATEAMPLTLITGQEILGETAAATAEGAGMCVGRPLPGITLRIIHITDAPIPTWEEAQVLPPGQVGEIVVKGPVVTTAYLNRPEKTAEAKIYQGDDVWHRMGDTGYLDEQGRVWFCGRKSHRIEGAEGPLYPVPCETIFNRHPDVARTALVGIGPRGEQTPVLVVEARADKFPHDVLARQRFTMELLALGAEYAHTRAIQDVRFYPGTFPTDVRHNAKIQREKLATWAARGSTRRPRLPHLTKDAVSYTGRRPPQKRLCNLLGLLSVVLGIVASVLWLRKRSNRREGQHRE